MKKLKIMWHVLEKGKGFLNNSWFAMKETVSCKTALRCTIKAPPTDSSVRSGKKLKICVSVR